MEWPLTFVHHFKGFAFVIVRLLALLHTRSILLLQREVNKHEHSNGTHTDQSGVENSLNGRLLF